MKEQSEFNYTQELVQPPPEMMVPKAPVKPGLKKLLIVLGLLGVLFILLLFVAVVGRQRQAPVETPMITPTVVPGYQEKSKTKLELERLKGLVDEANPASKPFPPPEIDMKVAF